MSIKVKKWYAVLATGEEEQTPIAEEEVPPAPKTGRLLATTSKRRRCRVVVGDSLLRGEET